MDMMNGVAGGKNLNTRWQRIADLKTRASVLAFLQRNNIADMEQLADKITDMHKAIYDTAKKITAAERRLSVLDEHLAQYENLKQHKAVYEKHKKTAPDKRNTFYGKYHDEITAYESAQRYFEKVMNGRTALPIKAWTEEQTRLTADKYALFEDYYKFKEDVRNVEVLRRGTENIIGAETRRTQPMQEQGIKL